MLAMALGIAAVLSLVVIVHILLALCYPDQGSRIERLAKLLKTRS